MQPPVTIPDFLALLEKSRLVDASRLDAIRKSLETPSVPKDPGRLADWLVKHHVLTPFQAEQLKQGRSKGFWVRHYKILGQVGIGGMSRVFLAEHVIMRRQVALKILPASKCQDEASLARFKREARAIASINHPNVVRAYDIDRDQDFFYIVLEYADGPNVAQFVEEHGPIPYPQACDYCCQAASGLEHLLECGIVHRDIKPANMILEKTGILKLCDFGLAVLLEEKDADPLTIRHSQNALGTADFLSPEQATDSHNVDHRADVYSLGATFFYMLTGRVPFPDGTVAQKLHAHQTATPPSVRDFSPDVPARLDAIVQRMLAKEPDDRFGSMAELRSALRPFMVAKAVAEHLHEPASNGVHPSANPAEEGQEPESPRRSRDLTKLVVAVSLAVLIAVASGGIWYYLT